MLKKNMHDLSFSSRVSSFVAMLRMRKGRGFLGVCRPVAKRGQCKLSPVTFDPCRLLYIVDGWSAVASGSASAQSDFSSLCCGCKKKKEKKKSLVRPPCAREDKVAGLSLFLSR